MPQDLRKYARQTNLRLILGGILLIFLIGDGLIYLFYGRYTALISFICLIIALMPAVLIWLMLMVLEWITKRADRL